MRLIDADKLRKDVLDLPNCYNGFSDTYDKAMIVDLVDEQPTVEAEPIRHGHWISACQTKFDKLFFPRMFKCSVCGNYLDFDGINAGWGDTNWCPNCGAKMDEVSE